MDPQACLQRIIDILEAIKPLPFGHVDVDFHKSQIADAFDDLAGWLRNGGFPPVATGPIFGTGPRAIGYPGMTRNCLPRYEPVAIRHLKNQMFHYRYVIMVVDHQDQACQSWAMIEYNHGGEEVNRWPFAVEVQLAPREPHVQN